MGMVSDMARRVSDVRIDDSRLQDRVKTARSFIYEKAYGISSTYVEELLQDWSLVPTKVRVLYCAEWQREITLL
jgi:hypothetical protein